MGNSSLKLYPFFCPFPSVGRVVSNYIKADSNSASPLSIRTHLRVVGLLWHSPGWLPRRKLKKSKQHILFTYESCTLQWNRSWVIPVAMTYSNHNQTFFSRLWYDQFTSTIAIYHTWITLKHFLDIIIINLYVLNVTIYHLNQIISSRIRDYWLRLNMMNGKLMIQKKNEL